nr:MAG: Transcriptional regulator, RHH-like, CopG [Bacteriophage sp.]
MDKQEKTKVTFRIDKELSRLIKLQAIVEDSTYSEIVEKAIEKYIKNK